MLTRPAIHQRFACVAGVFLLLCALSPATAHGQAPSTASARPEKASQSSAQPGAGANEHAPDAAAEPSRFERRIVHRFDFDERRHGNLEDEPMYWRILRMKGFPHFAAGSFDFQIGHAAPPSFYLSSKGRNVAYQYTGLDTRIRADAEYRIEGYIRPDRCTSARAALSAHFIDRSGRPLPGTLVRSRFIGEADDHREWTKVVLYLPAAPAEAQTIGLIAWLLQEDRWHPEVPHPRHIPRVDVHAGAWLDDITIYSLPHVDIRTSGTGNLLTPDGEQELRVVLADSANPDLEGRLTILNAAGETIETHRLTVRMDPPDEAVRVPVAHLPPGVYRAELSVEAGGTLLAWKVLEFARLAPRINSSAIRAREFGVVLSPEEHADSATVLSLLRNQLARAVKLPICGDLLDGTPPPPTGSPGSRRIVSSDTAIPSDGRPRFAVRHLHQDLHELAKLGFLLTGVLSDVSEAHTGLRLQVPSDGVESQPEKDGEAAAWNERLAAAIAPLVGVFHWWQVGADSQFMLIDSKEADRIITDLRAAMRRYITFPRIGTVIRGTESVHRLQTGTRSDAWAASERNGQQEHQFKRFPVEQVSWAVDGHTSLEAVRTGFEKLRGLGFESITAYVEPLADDAYRRLPRLAHWARQVILARHAGADTVYVPRAWHERPTPRGTVIEPHETYVLFRTIADVLAGTVPGPSIRVAQGAECLTFFSRGTATLVCWDELAPPEGRGHIVQLGDLERQFDVWGRAAALQRDRTGRELLTLSPMPVFVPNVDRLLVDVYAALSVEPAVVPAGNERSVHTLRFNYRGDRPVAGRMTLHVPPEWRTTPDVIDFRVIPGEKADFPFQIQLPYHEPIGAREIEIGIRLEDEADELLVPLRLSVEARPVATWGQASLAGDELLIRHLVTNRSSEPLRLRASAVLQGRERLHQPIPNFSPGEMQIVTYSVGGAKELAGQDVRLLLRELDGARRTWVLDLPVH